MLWKKTLKEEEDVRLKDPLLRDKVRPRYYSGSSSKPATLLIHGYTGSPYDLLPIHEMSRQMGRTTYSLLLPGHGGTTPRDQEKATPKDYRRAVVEAIHSLALSHKEGVDVVGFSVGGVLALDCAHESGVRSVTLINPFTTVPYHWYHVLPARTWSGILSGILDYVRRPNHEGSTACDIHDPEGQKEYEPSYQHICTEAYRQAQDYSTDVWNRIRGTRVPLAFFYCIGDKVSCPATMAAQSKRLCSKPGDLVIPLLHSGHVVAHDYDRHYLLNNIRHFWH